MSLEIQGTIKVINPEHQVSPTFKKRELVIVTDSQYPETILIEFVQDKCDLLDNCRVGEFVKVGINLGGREWVNPQGETKYFNSIKAWRIEKIQSEAPQSQSAVDKYMATATPEQAFTPSTDFNSEEHDDLPF